MQAVILVIHLIVAVALVSVILLQRSEGGALGMGGGPGGMMSGRGAANFLTRATKWLAIAFIGISLVLAVLARQGDDGTEELLRELEQEEDELTPPALDVPEVPTER
ncbi:MAG: preprotein translocase subunit SecG [Rhodothalassiaceae bacterium]